MHILVLRHDALMGGLQPPVELDCEDQQRYANKKMCAIDDRTLTSPSDSDKRISRCRNVE